MKPAPPKWRISWSEIGLYLALSLALQIAFIVQFYSRNWFSPILPWDDAAFIYRAMETYKLYLELGLVPYLIRGAHLHAPLADIQSIIGIAITPNSHAIVYLLNAVYTFGAALFLAYFFRGKSVWTKIFIFLIFFSFPMIYRIWINIKSDPVGGMALAFGALLLFEPGRRLPIETTRRLIVLAILFLTALLAKLTAVYLPIVFLGIIGLSIIRLLWLGEKGLGPEILRHLILVALVLGAYAMPVLLNLDTLTAYVTKALGTQWDDGFTLTEHLLFYAPFGQAGRLYTAHFLLTLVALGMVWRSVTLDWREKTGLAALFIILGVLIVPVLAARSTHNEVFAANVFFMVLGILLLAARFLTDHLAESRFPRLVLAAIVVGLFATYPPSPDPNDRFSPEMAQQAYTAYEEVSKRLEAQSYETPPKVVVLFSSEYVPALNLAIIHYRRTWERIYFLREDVLEKIPGAIADAEYVIGADKDGFQFLAYGNRSANRAPLEALGLVEANGNFEQVASFPVADYNMIIFERKR